MSQEHLLNQIFDSFPEAVIFWHICLSSRIAVNSGAPKKVERTFQLSSLCWAHADQGELEARTWTRIHARLYIFALPSRANLSRRGSACAHTQVYSQTDRHASRAANRATTPMFVGLYISWGFGQIFKFEVICRALIVIKFVYRVEWILRGSIKNKDKITIYLPNWQIGRHCSLDVGPELLCSAENPTKYGSPRMVWWSACFVLGGTCFYQSRVQICYIMRLSSWLSLLEYMCV